MKFYYFLVAGVTLMACNKQVSTTTNNVSTAATSAEKLNSTSNGICDYHLDEQSLIAQGYTKAYEDNFSSATDLNDWNVWNSGAYNHELQCYRPGNLQVTNGSLVLTAKRETVTGFKGPDTHKMKTFDFTSGRLESKTNFSASTATKKVRFTARIKLAAGYAMWPAFWSYGDTWPTEGEIDILETTGEDDQFTTDYFYGKTLGVVQTKDNLTIAIVKSGVSLSACYHVYEVIWEQNSLTFLFDGKIVDTKLATAPGGKFIPKFFEKTQHVALNLAVGGDNFPFHVDPALIQGGNMYVDRVKVFTSN